MTTQHLIARIKELEAALKAVPKCRRLDEDGKLVQDVPITPGMKLFYAKHPGSWAPVITKVEVLGVARKVLITRYSSCIFDIDSCFNTFEACESSCPGGSNYKNQ